MKKITIFLLFVLMCGLSFSQTFTSDTTSDPSTYPADMQNGTAPSTAATCGTANELTLPSTAVTGIGTLGGSNSLESVTLNVTHTWNADIVISLQDPSGAVTVLLTDDVGGNGDGFVNLVLQDGATALPTGNTSPLTGTFSPLEALAAFNSGTTAGDGVWNLLVCDDAGGDVGTVEGWALTFAPTPACLTPTDLGATPLTTTTAELSWTAGGTETSWDVEVVDITASGSFTGTPTDADVTNPYVAVGLTEGNDYEYYVRADCGGADGLSDWVGPFSWTQNVPPPNDLPAGAIPITPSPQGTGCASSTFTLPFSTDFTSDSGIQGGCSDSGLDQFFSWTATTDGLTFNSESPGSPGIVVWDAVTLTEIDCANTFATDDILSGWTIGQDLVIQIYDFAGSVSDVAFCLEEYTFPTDTLDYFNVQFPATGDIDLGSEFLVFAQAYEAGLTDASDDPAAGIEVWIGYNDADTDPNFDTDWTWVEASTNPGFDFTTNNDEFVLDLGAEISSGGTYYYASRFSLNGGPFTYGGILGDGSNGGQWGTDGYASGVLTVTAPPPPANDECADAIALTVNPDFDCGNVTNATIISATDSGEDDATCFGTPDDDIWFTFVATAEAHRVSLINFTSGTSDMYMTFYEGTCSTLGESIFCSDPQTANVNGLTIGNTYYVQVYTWTGNAGQTSTFDVCVGTPPAPPANDNACDAITLNMGDASTTAPYTNESATIETGETAGACHFAGDDADATVWFKFTAPNSGEVLIETEESPANGTLNDTQITLFTIEDCADLTSGVVEIACDEDDDENVVGTGGGLQANLLATELVIGAEYYIQIDGFSGSTGTFDLAITENCSADAGTLTADVDTVQLVGADVEISATEDAAPVLPTADYDVAYVLTMGTDLVIMATNTTPEFTVDTTGDYTIHTLVGELDDSASPNFLDTSVIVVGTTTGADVLGIIADNNLCADLLVVGAEVTVEDCAADAGTLTADVSPVPLDGGTADISATEDTAPTVPANYDVVYVLTMGTDLTIMDTGATPEFTVDAIGDYTIHTLVGELDDANDPNFLDTSVIVIGTTTGGDVLGIISSNGLCADLLVAGAEIEVDDSLSSDAFTKDNFSYYPNPINNELHFRAQSQIENVSIFNMLGQEVISVSPKALEADLNTASIAAGTYFAKVTIGNATKTIKLVKE